jgi:hypothetical protein
MTSITDLVEGKVNVIGHSNNPKSGCYNTSLLALIFTRIVLSNSAVSAFLADYTGEGIVFLAEMFSTNSK